MEDLLFTPLVLAVGFGIHLALLRTHAPAEHRVLNVAFVGHVVSGVMQVLLTRYYFSGGDMLGYFTNGVEYADVLRDDFVRYAPELARAFVQDEAYQMPFPVYGGGSTLSMSAASAFILFVLGNSLYASVTAVAIAAYVSHVLVYRALKTELPVDQQPALLTGINLLPSAVFWSSALLKEPLTMIGIGPAMLGLRLLSEGRRRVLAVAMLLPSAVLMTLIKPYVLMALSLAAGAFYFWKRMQAREALVLKPTAVVVAAALAFGGLLLGNKYFAKAESQSAAAALANQRAVGYATEGGSNFALDSRETLDIERRTLWQELALAPLALGTALFRPFLFEARNAVQLVNALEATFLLVLFVRTLRNSSLRQVLRRISASPALVFCVVFTLALALGTGLSTTNMGTLSRYRAPMMPFFFAVLLILDQDARRRTGPAPRGPLVVAQR